jgi:hypothetical protein
MSVRKLVVVLVIAIGLGMGVRLGAQVFASRPVPPTVLAGSDVGFRVEAIDGHDNSVVGHIVVKVDGQWVEARLGGALTTARPVQ